MFGQRLQGFRQSPASSTLNPLNTRKKVQDERKDRMSIERDMIINLESKELTYEHPMTKLSNSLTGSLSSQTYVFTIATLGNEAENHLFTLDLSSLPPGSQTLLTIASFKSFLLNYAATQFPAIYHLSSPTINGMYTQDGQQSNIVATSVVTGGVSTTVNPGGIIGFNVTYQNIPAFKSWDITGQNLITFQLLEGHTKTVPVYPLSNEMLIEIIVTRVQ